MKMKMLALAVLLAAPGLAHAVPITSGHADLDIDYSGGSLTLSWKTYTPMSAGTPTNNDNYTPAGNPISVPLANSYVVPAGAQWSCLGAAGTTVYRLKQANDPLQVWLGYNTEGVALGSFVNNKVGLQLVSVVSAPVGGRFVLYSTNFAGTPTYLLNSTAGACNISAFPGGGITANVHAHAWWAFSVPGVYVLRFRATGALPGGGSVSSANVDFTFNVP